MRRQGCIERDRDHHGNSCRKPGFAGRGSLGFGHQHPSSGMRALVSWRLPRCDSLLRGDVIQINDGTLRRHLRCRAAMSPQAQPGNSCSSRPTSAPTDRKLQGAGQLPPPTRLAATGVMQVELLIDVTEPPVSSWPSPLGLPRNPCTTVDTAAGRLSPTQMEATNRVIHVAWEFSHSTPRRSWHISDSRSETSSVLGEFLATACSAEVRFLCGYRSSVARGHSKGPLARSPTWLRYSMTIP